MAISVIAISHPPKQPYASASPTSQETGRICRYAGQAVRALPIRVITVGKKRSEGVRLLVDEYKTKLKPYCSFEDSLVRSNPRNAQDVSAQVKDEEVAIMKLLGSEDWVVVLDERGRDIDSEEMADLLGDAGNSLTSSWRTFSTNRKAGESQSNWRGASRISFCIGGAYGHGRQVRKRANVTIKLSSMVLNHQIALVLLMEQLYRSWTILKGQNYHH